MKPDGTLSVKPERDALQQLALSAGVSPEILSQQLSRERPQFNAEQQWTW
jgi:uncharacterized protein YidB (DUF937 family)